MKQKKLSIPLIFILLSTNLAGCWNYREIDKMVIVGGIAIDLNEFDGKYEVTAELSTIKSGKDSIIVPKYLSASGNSIFEIIRELITKAGQKLYFSHSKVIILSDSLARKGISEVIDWYCRDAETRTDVNILISKEKTAKEILISNSITGSLISFQLDEILRNEKNISTFPVVDLWDVTDNLIQNGLDVSIPTISIDKSNSIPTIVVDGTAIFKKDKLIGTINKNFSKFIFFAKDEIKGGLLVLDEDNSLPITFEIFTNKTKVNPITKNGNLKFNITTDTTVSLAEIQSQENFYTEEERTNLENRVSFMIENNIYASIKMLQEEYDTDIIGLGKILYQHDPKLWYKLQEDWEQVFKTLDISVNSKVKIKNSATTNKPVQIGD